MLKHPSMFCDKLKQVFYVKQIYSENSGIKTHEIYKNCKV